MTWHTMVCSEGDPDHPGFIAVTTQQSMCPCRAVLGIRIGNKLTQTVNLSVTRPGHFRLKTTQKQTRCDNLTETGGSSSVFFVKSCLMRRASIAFNYCFADVSCPRTWYCSN
jgi:hypothetical protein